MVAGALALRTLHQVPSGGPACSFSGAGLAYTPSKIGLCADASRVKLDLHEASRLEESVLTIRPERRLLDGKMAEKDDVLLNSREVAFLLDLSPDTVNEFARRNIIPAFKKGRQWRFRKRDIASVKRQLRGVNAAA